LPGQLSVDQTTVQQISCNLLPDELSIEQI